jgi:hypothetical protein
VSLPADLPAKPSKITKKLVSLSSSTRKSISGTNCKAGYQVCDCCGHLSISHTRRTCHVCCTSQYLCILIQDWRQECSLRSHTWRRLMSSVSTLEIV